MPKWKVYISSTFRDLKDLRGVLINLFQNEIQNSFELCDIMERMFDEGTQTPFVEDCIKAVLESDIYIIILGNKTGSFPPNESRTYTEIELDTAISNNKNIFCFYLDPFDEDEIDNKEKYQELRAKFDGKSHHPFKDGKELELVLLKHLHQFANKGPVNLKNPYKGLAAFNVEDGPYFFGRGAELEEFLKIITTSKGHFFISVVGNSGTGKSSFVQAGVLYRLKTDDKFGYKEHKQCIITPGSEPYTNLEYQLKLQGVSISDIINPVKEPPKLILYFDQFEEVITQCISAEALEEKEKLVGLLNGLLKRPDEHSDIVVICTYRSDFISQLANFKFIRSKKMVFFPLNSLDYKVHQDNWDRSITEIITKPAEENGVKIEEELVNQLLNELKEVDGSLPILEFTLQRLWNNETIEDRIITATEFSSLSEGKGIGGIIQVHADGVFKRISANNKTKEAILKSIFVNLVEVNESQNDVRRTIEKRNLFNLLQATYPEQDIQDVFEDLVSEKSRLLSVSSEKGKPIKVTIIHEALIRKWERLQRWVGERREALSVKKKIEMDLKPDKNGKVELYNRKQLKRAQKWAKQNPDFYTEQIDSFLKDSQNKVNRKNAIARSIIVFVSVLAMASYYWIYPSYQKTLLIEEIKPNEPRLWEDIQVAGGIDVTDSIYFTTRSMYRKLKWFKNANFLSIASLGEKDLQILENLSYPERLSRLEISGNSNLESLQGLESLTNLTILGIYNNGSLESLQGLESLTNLTTLEIGGNTDLQGIESLKNLSNLKITGNTELQGLESLTNLTTLKVEYNDNLKDLQGLESLKNLTTLEIYGNDELTDLQGLESLTNLTTLEISRNVKLTDLQGLESLTNLTTLEISRNVKLTDLQGLESLKNLTTLEISGNTVLQGLESLKNLTTLEISGNTELQGLESLKNLTTLEISWNSTLESLQGLESLTNLTTLEIYRNGNLESLKGLEPLKNLTTLKINLNDKLTDLQGLESLKNLTTLNIYPNDKLTDLQGLESFKNLTTLQIYGNYKLTDLHGLKSLTNLTTLKIYLNDKLTDLQGLESLKNLTTLEIYRNDKLKDLQSLESLKNLTTLEISDNGNLEALQGLESLKNLTTLEINGNDKLTDLQGLESLKNLTTLKVAYNNNLKSLKRVERLKGLKKLSINYGTNLNYKKIKENNPGIEIKLLDDIF